MRHATYPSKKRIHPLGWVGIGLGVVLVALVAWVGVRGLIAKNDLESALPLVSELKDSIKAVDLDGAQETVATVAASTANARAMTSDPVWRFVENVPGIGPNLSGFRELTAVTDDIVTGVLVPVASLGDTLNPKALKPVDGRINTALFASAVPVIHEARENLEASYADVQAIDTTQAIGAISGAQKQLVGMLKPMIPLVQQADELVTLVPGLLGAEGPRNYLLVFQNNSESRALGGHAGSWVQMSVDDGKIDLARQSNVQALRTGGAAVIDVGDYIRSLWLGAAVDPSNVTLVPRLDLAAKTAQAFWANKFAVQVDAVVFIDPVALGYILAATGPIEVPTGDVLDSKNAADFLLNGVYLKYPLNSDQDRIFDSIGKLTFGAITSGDFNPQKLVSAAMKGGATHRILTYFFNEAEQEQFAKLPFALETPVTDDKTAGFGVYITDNLGSKMTYYMDATVELGQAKCAAGDNRYEVKVTITNTITPEAGAALPAYVAPYKSMGALRVLVTLYAPPGSSFIREAAAGWDPDYVTLVGLDGEYPAMTQRVSLAPGQSISGIYVLTTPDDNLDRKLTAYVTPMARAVPVKEFDYSC